MSNTGLLLNGIKEGNLRGLDSLLNIVVFSLKTFPNLHMRTDRGVITTITIVPVPQWSVHPRTIFSPSIITRFSRRRTSMTFPLCPLRGPSITCTYTDREPLDSYFRANVGWAYNVPREDAPRLYLVLRLDLGD